MDKVAELREKGQLHKPTKKRKSKNKLTSNDASGDCGGGFPGSSKKVSLKILVFMSQDSLYSCIVICKSHVIPNCVRDFRVLEISQTFYGFSRSLQIF